MDSPSPSSNSECSSSSSCSTFGLSLGQHSQWEMFGLNFLEVDTFSEGAPSEVCPLDDGASSPATSTRSLSFDPFTVCPSDLLVSASQLPFSQPTYSLPPPIFPFSTLLPTPSVSDEIAFLKQLAASHPNVSSPPKKKLGRKPPSLKVQREADRNTSRRKPISGLKALREAEEHVVYARRQSPQEVLLSGMLRSWQRSAGAELRR